MPIDGLTGDLALARPTSLGTAGVEPTRDTDPPFPPGAAARDVPASRAAVAAIHASR